MQRNQIEVLTIGYIDSDELWPRIFKNVRLSKFQKAPDEAMMAGMLFYPARNPEGKLEGYTVRLVLEGKTTSLYTLLQVSEEEMALIAEETTTTHLGRQYPTPKEAQEEVVSALIAAMERIEQRAGGACRSPGHLPAPSRSGIWV